jgi:caa(3)-type oxidase subunit IV
MNNKLLLAVWAYLVAATVAEAEIYYQLAASALVTASVAILAASQALAVVVFYMHLKEEPNSLRLFAIIPIMFLAALLVVMVASLG